jgi:GWxTD domain-containing protein
MVRSRVVPPGVAIAAAALAILACGQWQRVGSGMGPDPSVVLPRLFDPAGLYTQMGFLAHGPPLPFVGHLRYLATPSPDSTLAVFAVSLANNSFSFRRAGEGFEARYRVDLILRREGTVARRVSSEETVRVGTREEALRADESVIFQQVVFLAPGNYQASVAVRDEFSGAQARTEHAAVVPRFTGPGLSDLIPVYEVAPRTDLDTPLRVLVNTRATVPYGMDSLRLYLEAYGASATGSLSLTVFDEHGDEVWSGEAPLQGERLRSAVIALGPDRLPVGRLRLVTRAGTDSSVAPALVSFSDQWAITNFEDVLFLLRHFGQERAINRLSQAPETERPQLWREFLRATDPNPATPENEALEQYFRRLLVANSRFEEAGEPGWLSDRGEVYITLGEPDEVFDLSSDFQGARRIIRWNYFSHRLTLDFVDETGFGRFRLTPSARAEYQRVLNAVRSRG